MATEEPTKMPADPVGTSGGVLLQPYRRTPAMIHSIDVDCKIVEVSDYWLEVMGYNRDEVIGHKIVEFLTEDSRNHAETESLTDFTLQKGSGISGITREFVKKNGTIIEVELNAVWECDDFDKLVRSLTVLTDVSKRNRAKRALVRINAELEASNEQLERFAFMAAHDLQEPLRKIEAAYNAIREEPNSWIIEEKKQFFDMALEATTGMRNIIEDLLRFSRVGSSSINYVHTDLTGPLKEAISNLERQIKETGALIEIGQLPTLHVDQGLIRQLLQNLVSNALKYRSNRTPKIRIDAQHQGNIWIVRVTDNGIGILNEHRHRIFEIFQRLHSESDYPGTGIGLAICKRIVERHGGKIWLDPDYENGSRFCIQLPVTPPEQAKTS